MSDDQGQSLVDVESAFEDSRAVRMRSKHKLDASKGRYHMELVARREAGVTMTATDMKAMEDASIDSIDYVRDAYMAFIAADSSYRAAKVKWENAKRNYWDQKSQFSHR